MRWESLIITKITLHSIPKISFVTLNIYGIVKVFINKAIINFPMVNHIRFKILGIFNSTEYILSNALLVLILKMDFALFAFLLWVMYW